MRDTRRFLLRYLSEPKAQIVFERPPRLASAVRFRQGATGRGLVLDRSTRMIYAGAEVGINGEHLRVPAGCSRPFHTLADQRAIDPATLATLPDPGHAVLHAWYAAGWLHLQNEGARR